MKFAIAKNATSLSVTDRAELREQRKVTMMTTSPQSDAIAAAVFKWLRNSRCGE